MDKETNSSGRCRAVLRSLAAAAVGLLTAAAATGLPVTWQGPDGSFWDLAANWNPALPGALDDVLLGTFDTEIRSGGFDIRSLTGSGRLTLSNGSLSVSAASTIGAYAMTGGTLGGSGPVTVDGPAAWSSGVMAGPGSTTFNGGLALTGAGLRELNAARTLNTGGTTTWSNSASDPGRIRIVTSATLNNAGTWLDQNGFDTRLGDDLLRANGEFNNTGSYIKTGAGTTDIAHNFNNSGVVAVNSGTLHLRYMRTGSGRFTGLAGTTLQFGGDRGLLASSSIDTAGSVVFSGTGTVAGSYNAGTATRTIGGFTTLTGMVSSVGPMLAANGGQIVLANAQAIVTTALVIGPSAGPFPLGGILTFNNAGGVSATTLELSSGGELMGSSAVVISGASTWGRGSMFGPGSTTLNGPLDLGGDGVRSLINRRTLNTAGVTTWANASSAGAGRIEIDGLSTINNTGSWRDQNAFDTQLGWIPNSGVFINAGSYVKSGSGTTRIYARFDNAAGAALAVDAGTLVLFGGSTGAGSFSGAGTLVFRFGEHTLAAGSSVSNANVLFSSPYASTLSGSYSVAGITTVSAGSFGTVNFNGNVANVGGGLVIESGQVDFNTAAGVVVRSLVMSGGTLGGTQAVTVDGPVDWTLGVMSGAGTTTVNGALVLSGSGPRDLDAGRTLRTAGITTWTGASANDTGRIRTGGGATIHNTGTWLDANAVNTRISNDLGGAASTFFNAGTYLKVGAGTTDIGISLFNPGTVAVNSGTLALSGSASFDNTGTLTGRGTLRTTQLRNNGHLRPGAPLGTLTLAGNYIQGVSGSLAIGLNVPGQTGALVVEGSAALDGTLALSCAFNCSFAVGDSILILDSTGALSGSFAAITLSNFFSGAFDVVYDTAATQVRLVVTQTVTPVPEPSSVLMILSGLLLLATRVRRAPDTA
ncbi:MAG: PEP-CTERM sorting domain-containing protein [Chitinophagaceae bacterium]|nr:PEP-CTERM sorting domain-containing protein [Rubrivivax sp.]